MFRIALPLNSNHAQELHHMQSRSIAGSPAPVLRCMPVGPVLFQGLSEGRLEKAAQENLQACQHGAWRHHSRRQSRPPTLAAAKLPWAPKTAQGREVVVSFGSIM
jgi:hypothetical protein